jgi:polysaccharide biosynthesis transport protein
MRNFQDNNALCRPDPSGDRTIQAYPAQANGSWLPSPDYSVMDTALSEEPGGLMDYWHSVRRHKGKVILCCLLGGGLGYLLCLPQPRVYKAHTTIEIQDIDPGSSTISQVPRPSQPYNALSDIQTQVRILESDSLTVRALAKVASRLPGADSNAKIEPEKAAETLPYVWKRAADDTKVRALGDARIVEISVDSTDRNVAADFANTLANEYIDQSTETRVTMNRRTSEWLAQQLDEMRRKLEGSEYKLQSYARHAGLLYTGGTQDEGKTNMSEDRLRQVQEALSTAAAERVTKESRYRVASTTPPDALPDVLNDPTLMQYRTQLTELKRKVADLSTVYTPDFSNIKRLQGEIQTLQAAFDRERSLIVDKIKNDYDQAVLREQMLVDGYAKQAETVTADAEKSIQYHILKREVDSNRQIYENMLQRVRESSINAALKAPNIRVLDPAKPSRFPYKPSFRANTALGAFLGLFVGVGLAVFRDRTDRSIRSPGGVQPWLNVPELGVIPSKDVGVKRADRKQIVLPESMSRIMAEAFRVVLTSVVLSEEEGTPRKVLVVTSASPSEGKTTVAANLAHRLSNIGRKVLLIDADLPRPCLHHVFGLENEHGLTSVLQGESVDEAALANAVYEISPTLCVLPAGPRISDAGDLLFVNHMPELLSYLKTQFDMIIIDTPPTPQMSHARILGRLADGVIVVIRAGQTQKEAAAATIQRFYEDRTHVVGTVLNDWDPSSSTMPYYKRYYDEPRRQ